MRAQTLERGPPSALAEIGGVVIVVIIGIVVMVTGGKQSKLLVFWTWLGLEFDNNSILNDVAVLTMMLIVCCKHVTRYLY